MTVDVEIIYMSRGVDNGIRCQWIDVDDGSRRPAFNVDPLGVTGELVWEGGQVIGWRIRGSQWNRYLGGGHWLK